jgi:hypothetical protein
MDERVVSVCMRCLQGMLGRIVSKSRPDGQDQTRPNVEWEEPTHVDVTK